MFTLGSAAGATVSKKRMNRTKYFQSIKKIKKPFFWVLGVYVALHLALVPILSIATRNAHNTSANPRKWGLVYTAHEVKSSFGITLPAWYIPGDPHKPIILILTGSSGNKYGTITRLTSLYLHKEGYNLFLFDTRGQGQSSGIKTYGIGEVEDVVQVLDYLSRTFPDKKVGAIGFSMGGATILRAAGMDDRLAAVAAFASYSEMDYALIHHELYVQSAAALSRGLSDRKKKRASLGARSAQIILSPLLTRVALKAWSFTLLPVPSPKQSISRLDGRAVLLMHNTGDPEIPIQDFHELYHAAKTLKKSRREFLYSTHPPAFWSMDFKYRFRKIIQDFFNQQLP